MREKPKTAVLAWYFAPADEKLRHGDGRAISVGTTHTVGGEPIPCIHGLHASRNVLDALDYASSGILYRVRLDGRMKETEDKIAATSRTYLARVDASGVLLAFARQCALDVSHLWDAPPIVREFLKTGNAAHAANAAAKAAKAAANAAAYASAHAAHAAYASAHAAKAAHAAYASAHAAKAASAACEAAYVSASATYVSAHAAGAAARMAARAVKKKQNAALVRMVREAMNAQP